ncbi:MAG: preprotein translocase subunit SecG [Pseudomonadota bacterium]
MNTLFNLVVVVQVLSALAIIGLVLLQHGKGADMGAAFGSGASGSLFGATGSSNFMSKSTGVAAAIFFSATLGLSFMANERTNSVGGGVMEKVTQPVAPVSGSAAIPTSKPAAAPAAPAAAPAAAAPASSVPATQIPK